MAVNAQSILETVKRNAQKNIPTNKIKKAAVPDLSMFGIPPVGTTTVGTSTGGITTAAATVPTPITPNNNSLMTGVNATASPIKAAPTREPQSSFLPQRKATQGQVYPELAQDDLVEDESPASPVNFDEPRSEEECSAAIEYLMEQAVRIRRAVDSRRDIAERLENQQSEFSTLFQSQYTPKLDLNHFVSNAELARTVSKQGILRVAAYIRVSTDSDDQEKDVWREAVPHRLQQCAAGLYGQPVPCSGGHRPGGVQRTVLLLLPRMALHQELPGSFPRLHLRLHLRVRIGAELHGEPVLAQAGSGSKWG